MSEKSANAAGRVPASGGEYTEIVVRADMAWRACSSRAVRSLAGAEQLTVVEHPQKRVVERQVAGRDVGVTWQVITC